MFSELIHPSATIPQDVHSHFSEINKMIAYENQEYNSFHRQHLENSKREILQTADVALARTSKNQEKKALLLGAGNCFDIPLEEISQRFDKVTLVELDRTATEKAIQNLPPQLQKKITLVVADISGITYEFCKDMNDMLEKSKDLNGFLQKGADLTLKQTQKISGRTPDVGNNYTFICSQLLMSQLLTIPNLYIQEAVEKKFGSTLSSLGTNAEFFRNNTQLKFALQREHINYLGQSVSNNGTVHLADTYVSKETFQEKPGYLLLDDIINPEIQKFFNPLKETSEWIWRRLPESRFGVKSHALEPIPQKNLRSRR